MSDYNSNYDCVCCPHCGEQISNNKKECCSIYNLEDKDESSWVNDLEDEDYDFFQCRKCEKFFKAQLDIYKEYEYTLTVPTEEDIKKHNLINSKKEDIAVDIPGQTFMWDNLFFDES